MKDTELNRIGQFHRSIERQFLIVHLLFEFRHKGINTDKAVDLVAAHPHVLGHNLVGTLAGAGELVHFGTTPRFTGQRLHLHFGGAGQF